LKIATPNDETGRRFGRADGWARRVSSSPLPSLLPRAEVFSLFLSLPFSEEEKTSERKEEDRKVVRWKREAGADQRAPFFSLSPFFLLPLCDPPFFFSPFYFLLESGVEKGDKIERMV